MAVSPEPLRPTRKTSPAAQRTGGHRRVATRETTGDLATRRGAGDPERRAEWMTVSRYGHLRSAPVVVDAGYARSGNRPHSLQRCLNSTRQSRRLLDGFLPLHNAQVRLHCQRVRVVVSFLKATREGPEVRERLQRVSIAVYLVAFGLYRPVRRPVRAGGPYSGVQNYVKRAVTVCVLFLKMASLRRAACI